MRRWWWAVGIVVVVSMIASVLAWSLMTYVPYVIEAPGNLYTTGDRISVSGATTYPTTDKIDLVTVTLDTRVTHFDKFLADHNGDDQVFPAAPILGNQTPAQNDALNALMMKQSKDAAVLVALDKLGYNVQGVPTGAVVESTEAGAPADHVIDIAQTIVAINDQPVASADGLRAVLAKFKQGDRVTVTLEAPTDQARSTVDITLADNPKSPGIGYLGVGVSNRLAFPEVAVKVNVDSGAIGGPSAGLAFTLGILDFMTPGDLTGGHEVAATGTIDADGTVGPIGGIESKVLAVSRQHVKYFLVPTEDAADARAKAPKDLQIVPVATLDDALAFLATIGGSGLPASATASGP